MNADRTTMAQPVSKSLRLIVPQEQAISVEHPCIIKNAEKAIDMIGGSSAISQALEPESVKTFALSFHPQDPAAHTVLANRREADNVLLSVTVPKRTGRKRKRGSNDPWTEDNTAPAVRKDTSYLIRSLVDNPTAQNVRALSGISSTHVWRSMPDFAFSTANTQILQDVKSKILSQHYPSIKEFDIPKTHGLEDTTTLPPRVWSNQSIPINYAYRQNPSVKLSKDPVTGETTYRNTQEAPKVFSYQVQWDTVDYPTSPMPGLPPIEEASEVFKTTTAALKELFSERPIYSRRALLNSLQSDLTSFNVVRYCLAYVAFAARSGPWRDTYVRLGVDPRTDPKYRIYQSVMLQLVPKQNTAGEALQKNYQSGLRHGANASRESPDVAEESASLETTRKTAESRQIYSRFWVPSKNKKSHIFDGVSPVPPDGKVWQLCDITDPQIAALRDLPTDQLRPECDNRYFGWYWNGTSAKIRVVLRAKVDALINNTILDPSDLEPIMKLSENIDPNETDPSRTNPDAGSESDSQNANEKVGAVSAAAAERSAAPRTDSAYLPVGSTKQQTIWAATYRSLARTGPGVKGSEEKAVRKAKSKTVPMPRKTRAAKDKESAGTQPKTRASRPSNDEPITHVESATDSVMILDNDEDIPQSVDGEAIMPSIEIDGFDDEEDDGSELGLEVKLEDDLDEDYTQNTWPETLDPDNIS